MCTRPLHFFRSDIPDEEGKYPGFITGYQQEYATYDDFERRDIPCTLAHRVKAIPVPCGKCPECLRQIKYRWVGRCVAEMETTPFTYFLTLTYNDENLRDVNKRDLQLFIKRLRSYIDCRYLAVGEYGSLSNRPHYHLIIFSQDELKDLSIFKRGIQPLYRSEIIDKIWPYGYASVGRGEASSISYTVGYLVSKEKKTAFKLQSNGLGAEFFKSLKERYILSTGRGSEIYVSLPRYLKDKYNLKFEVDSELQELLWNNEIYVSRLPEYEYRDFKEYLQETKLKV